MFLPTPPSDIIGQDGSTTTPGGSTGNVVTVGTGRSVFNHPTGSVITGSTGRSVYNPPTGSVITVGGGRSVYTHPTGSVITGSTGRSVYTHPTGSKFVPTPPHITPVGTHTITPPPATIVLTTHIRVVNLPSPVTAIFDVNITVKPPIPVFTPLERATDTSMTLVPIPMNLRDAMVSVLKKVTNGKVDGYFDVDRRGKTILNFGQDFQALMTDWQYQSGSNYRMDIKLYEPLPDDVEEKTQLWVSRELSPPVVDRLFVRFTPPPPPKVYLRPPNTNISVLDRTGAKVENATLSNLLTTGSLNVVRPTDPVVEEWFTTDVNSVELNIDYSDYRNFIFFGSATGRLTAFINKLLLVEDYDRTLFFNSASLSGTGSAYITGSTTYPALQALSDKRVDLIRSFDGYERFLYYGSGSAYSSSLNTNDYQDATYYASDATWPKLNGAIAPVASASAWITSQLVIASDYDTQNQNYLANNIPAYLKQDERSQDFITFVDLVGHQFDLIKTYIDHMSDVYDRDSNPSMGMSSDLAWNMAEAFGIDMPNQYAIKNLVDYTIGRQKFVNDKVYREVAAETWKRFLHNQIFLMKTKGTKTSLRTLANSYGVLPTTLQIRESITPGTRYTTDAYELFEEQTTVLNIPSGSYVQLPWAASSSMSSSTVEVRFATTDNTTNTVLLAADNIWGLRIEPLSGSYGRLTLLSGSVPTLSSSYLPLYSGDYYSAMLRYNTTGMELQIKRAEGGDIVASSQTVATNPFTSAVWFTPVNLYLGGSGSFFGRAYAGMIDEFRMWGEQLTDNTFDTHARYPGMYNGNTVTSTRDNLFVRLSFNTVKNLGVSTFLPNEAPSFNTQVFPTINFPNVSSSPFNMAVIIRESQRYSPNAGTSNFTTNKVIVAPPPVLKYSGQTQVPVLSRNQSIVSLQDKQEHNRSTNVVGFYFSVTDAINDSIARSVGAVDLQSLIGDPSDEFSTGYKDLQVLADLYWSEYAYNFNINSFVSFVEQLLGPLFQQAQNLVPIRTKLLSGIVHEPHVLERSKAPLNPINLSGGWITRDNQTDTQNLLIELGTSQPDTSAGSMDSYTTVIATTEEFDTSADDNTFEATLSTEDISNPTADMLPLDSVTSLSETTTLTSVFTTYDDFTNRLATRQNFLASHGVSSEIELSPSELAAFQQVLSTYRSGVNINNDYLVYSKNRLSGSTPDGIVETVLPYTNFDTLEATTYFSLPNGLYAVPTTVNILINSASLTDRGSWQKNTTYSRNDLVLQVSEVGDAAIGNSKSFVCISPDRTFTSIVAPYLDTRNWKAASYMPTLIPAFRTAVVISGSVSLVVPPTTFPVAVGYRPEHFKFTRDRHHGTTRHQWLGCVQDNTTTTDGKDPVEIFVTAGSELVVRNPGDPIQSNNNQSGPILDIQ